MQFNLIRFFYQVNIVFIKILVNNELLSIYYHKFFFLNDLKKNQLSF